MGYFFCAAEAPQADPFFGHSMYIPDMICRDSLATVVVSITGNLPVEAYEIDR